jgi:hypothetical protein
MENDSNNSSLLNNIGKRKKFDVELSVSAFSDLNWFQSTLPFVPSDGNKLYIIVVR